MFAMRLAAIRRRFGNEKIHARTPAHASSVGRWLGIGMYGLLVLILGAGAAIFPAPFITKFGFILGSIMVLLVAILAPGDAPAPKSLLRLLLQTVTVCCVLWPIYLSHKGLPGPGVNPTRLAYWSMAGLFLFWFIASRDARAQVPVRIAVIRPFAVLLTAYVGWASVCALASDYPFMSVYHLCKLMVGPLLVFFVALSCLRGKRDVDTLLTLLVLAGLGSCAVAAVEAIRKTNIFYETVPFLFPDGDSSAEDWTEGLIRDKSRGGDYRVMATFSHPLTFGEYLAMSFPAAVYMAGFAARRWQRLLGALVIPVMLAGIYVTHTRSTLLAIGVAMITIVTLLGLRAMNQRGHFAASVAGAFTLVATMFSLLGLIGIGIEMAAGQNSGEVGSSIARMIMLKRGVTLAFESPLLGYGSGMAAFTLGLLPGFTRLTIDSHYLTVALESGLPGLVLFSGMLGYLVVRGVRAALLTDGKDGVRIAVIVSALISFAFVKSVLSLTENLDIAFLLMALLAISLEPERADHAADSLAKSAQRNTGQRMTMTTQGVETT